MSLYYKFEDNTHVFCLNKQFLGEKIVVPENYNRWAAEMVAKQMFKM